MTGIIISRLFVYFFFMTSCLFASTDSNSRLLVDGITAESVSNVINIRCFDLGGNGLKTALFQYDLKHQTMRMVSDVTSLGKCGDNKEVHKWIRERMSAKNVGDLDSEMEYGFLFGFSLAGLDKLRRRGVPTQNISKLFHLQNGVVGQIDDGGAHLLASLQMVEDLPDVGRIWNFSLGTSVGFGFTNTHQQIRTLEEVKFFFGQPPWNVKEPTTGQSICRAGSACSYDDILACHHGDSESAMAEFAYRWQRFIEEKIITYSQISGKEWGRPDAVVFTGGHVEWHGDALAMKLNESALSVRAYTGPKQAGLYGAAYKALEAYILNSHE